MTVVRKIIAGVVLGLGALVVLVLVGGGIAWLRLHPSRPGLQVWTNGQVLTMDPEGRRATALVIDGDRIIAPGSDEDVQPWASKATEVDFTATQDETVGRRAVGVEGPDAGRRGPLVPCTRWKCARAAQDGMPRWDKAHRPSANAP